MLYTLVKPIIRAVLFVFGPLTVEGRDNVPRKGGVLLVSNHLSNADPAAIAAACPRECWFMAKEELFEMRLLGPLIRALNAFPVKPRMADRSALRTAESHLKKGRAVVMFPEGECSETGRLQEFLPGAALIVRRTGVQVIPIGLQGTQKIMPYGSMVPRPAFGGVRLRFGPPVPLGDKTREGATHEQIAARMMKAVAALADQPLPDAPVG